MQKTYKLLPIESLQRGEYQPRKQFNQNALHDLAQSILAQGLIEPLIVREIAKQRYEIIAGERRWRAAMLANLTEVPCLIGHYTDQQTAAVTLIENIQRENLNLLEEARGYERLQTEFHFSQDEIAALVGKSRSHIANILRLLTLSIPVQDYIKSNQLSLGHARALVGLSTEQQLAFTKRILNEHWSVRRLEQALRQNKEATTKTPALQTPHLTHLENQLAEHLGAPVTIDLENNQGGWLRIKFFDNETLSSILEKLGLRYD